MDSSEHLENSSGQGPATIHGGEREFSRSESAKVLWRTSGAARNKTRQDPLKVIPYVYELYKFLPKMSCN